jgi:peptide/nickel transport system substrate-binding protein
MWAPQVNGYNAKMNVPYKYDPAKSKKLLAEAGYPNGFTVGMDCPNNRYVNDEKICQAVAGMLAKVGIKVDLLAQPKSKYFAKVTASGGYNTPFYLLGWTPGSMDVYNVFMNLIACRDKKNNMGKYNIGGYCNKRVDELTKLIAAETDPKKRQAYIDEGAAILKKEYGYIPLHQQPLSWGVSEKVSVAQRADNVMDIRNVVVNK